MMNILKAIAKLKIDRSISIEQGVLTRRDSGGVASYSLEWRDGTTTSDFCFLHNLDKPAFVLELVWGLQIPYTPSKVELLAWLERYAYEQPSLFVGMNLQKIVEFILERKPTPSCREVLCNRLFEYLMNNKELVL